MAETTPRYRLETRRENSRSLLYTETTPAARQNLQIDDETACAIEIIEAMERLAVEVDKATAQAEPRQSNPAKSRRKARTSRGSSTG
jgi:hypothetical protein